MDGLPKADSRASDCGRWEARRNVPAQLGGGGVRQSPRAASGTSLITIANMRRCNHRQIDADGDLRIVISIQSYMYKCL